MKPRGYYYRYHGPDGAPLVMAITLRSENAKTADLAQVWFFRADLPPSAAASIGADRSVCGDCQHRGTSCYVVLWRGPDNVFYAVNRGSSYQELNLSDAKQVSILRQKKYWRIGAYGESVTIPYHWWNNVFFPAVRPVRWTGYTHQWRDPELQSFRFFLMASVDSEAEAREAVALGWRYFRVRSDDVILPGEIDCPASETQGHRLTCAECFACNGLGFRSRKPGGNVSIQVHGYRAKQFGG